MRRGRWGGVVGDGGGKEDRTNLDTIHWLGNRGAAKKIRTRGALRYSIPILRARRDVLRMSFMRLYRSTLKLSVGPAESFTIRKEGAIGVKVKASKWVTSNVGARVR